MSCEFVLRSECSRLTEARTERMVDTEYPLTRVVALFSLYTFFTTQPRTRSPSLHSVEHIEIPIGFQLRCLYLGIIEADLFVSL